jgi:O6-methylguanine-DNA--protein-cysteine methyltransferase
MNKLTLYFIAKFLPTVRHLDKLFAKLRRTWLTTHLLKYSRFPFRENCRHAYRSIVYGKSQFYEQMSKQLR